MKVLLVDPPYQRFIGYYRFYFPLGLTYLAAVLHNLGHEVVIYDAEHDINCISPAMSDTATMHRKYVNALNNYRHPIWVEYTQLLSEFQPNVVGVSVLSVKLASALKIAELTKQFNNNIIVVAGGEHVTVRPQSAGENVDYVICGEGEHRSLLSTSLNITMNKILILGSSGFLGSAIVDAAPDNVELWLGYNNKPLNNHAVRQIKINLSDFNLVKEWLFEIKPQLVIHAARIYPFEDDENQAAVITNNLAAVIKSINARLLYISSDAVFDGQKGDYQESDLTNPITDYGKAKLAAETVIQKELDNFIIIRPSYIFGNNRGVWDKRTSALLDKMKKRTEVLAFHDMCRSPIEVKELALAGWQLVSSDFKGIIHLAGRRQSILEFNQKIAVNFGFNPNIVKRDSIHNSKSAVAPNTSLNTSLAQKIIGFKPVLFSPRSKI